MTNRNGAPIWYELLTNDAAASKTFYDDVIGWNIGPEGGASGVDYRMIATSDGSFAGGMLTLTAQMRGRGAKPTWLFYVGVDDVDEAAKLIAGKGGSIHLAPFDIAEVGRAAMVADPQGNPFYVMRAANDASGAVWDRAGLGKCSWNELVTSAQSAGNAFYADVFGWTYPHKMEMPAGMGDYMFIDASGQAIGATMQASAQPGRSKGWRFYFRAPDIDVAAQKVRLQGGVVHAGPMTVPGGDRVIVASDPQGVDFGVVAQAG